MLVISHNDYDQITMPKIVIAPQEFKGSLSAIEIARAIEVGVLRAIPHAETVLAPVADGGDGTLQSLVDSSGGRIESAAVTGPLGEVLVAEWGALGDGETAVIEMARSSGLALLDLDDRDPRMATTKGVGELIAAALDTGHTRFIIGIGGSATNDGGAGMMQALGASLLDSAGRELGPGGAVLAKLDRIDVSNVDPRSPVRQRGGGLRRQQPTVRPHRGIGGIRSAKRRYAGDGR